MIKCTYYAVNDKCCSVLRYPNHNIVQFKTKSAVQNYVRKNKIKGYRIVEWAYKSK